MHIEKGIQVNDRLTCPKSYRIKRGDQGQDQLIDPRAKLGKEILYV